MGSFYVKYSHVESAHVGSARVESAHLGSICACGISPCGICRRPDTHTPGVARYAGGALIRDLYTPLPGNGVTAWCSGTNLRVHHYNVCGQIRRGGKTATTKQPQTQIYTNTSSI